MFVVGETRGETQGHGFHQNKGLHKAKLKMGPNSDKALGEGLSHL